MNAATMSAKYQVRKVRRDGVSQRYWVVPTREHDDAVIGVISGDLATAESRREQEIVRNLMQEPSVQESLYRSLVRHYKKTKSYDTKPMLFLRHYLSRGCPEAESLLVRLATELSNWHVRAAAIQTIAKSMDPRVPRLIREVIDKSPDDWTARVAIFYLARYLNITMENMITEGITPTRDAILDALEMLGLALQGKWFKHGYEVSPILDALNYNRSEFERAAQGQIPTRVEEQVIDGLVSVFSIEALPFDEFEKALNVIKNWRSAYALAKLRSLLSDSLPQQRRQMVIDAMNEIEHQLKRNSSP